MERLLKVKSISINQSTGNRKKNMFILNEVTWLQRCGITKAWNGICDWYLNNKSLYLDQKIMDWKGQSSLVAQWVKNPVLSLLWWRFYSWPGNFCMPQPKKKICLQAVQKQELGQDWPKEFTLLTSVFAWLGYMLIWDQICCWFSPVSNSIPKIFLSAILQPRFGYLKIHP